MKQKLLLPCFLVLAPLLFVFKLAFVRSLRLISHWWPEILWYKLTFQASAIPIYYQTIVWDIRLPGP